MCNQTLHSFVFLLKLFALTLNYKKFGEGKSVIILHGLFGMLDNWKSFARKLSSHFEVFIIDQRDHGKSPHTDTFDYTTLAEDINQFIVRHNINPYALIGHSMGGKTAMQFVNDHPGAVNKLIVVDIGPNKNPENHQTIFKALKSIPVDQIESRSEAEEILEKFIDEQSIRLFLMKNLSRTPEGGYKWKMNLDLLISNYSNILAEIPFYYPIDIPTLFVKGGQSKYIDEENIDKIHDVFLHHEIFEFPDAGHWVHAEKPDELLDKTRLFLDN